MAASVRIEDEAFADERYEELAVAAGLADADHARERCCSFGASARSSNDTLPIETLVRIIGAFAVEALLKSRLGEHTEPPAEPLRKIRLVW